MATQVILPPINPQRTTMTCQSAPVSPNSLRRRGNRLPPASRTTLALNPDFNEFQDPVELDLQSREINSQIIDARKSLIPLQAELRRLEYQYDPNTYDPQIKNMKAQIEDLKREKKDLDEQLNEIRRTCQGSIYSTNDIQNDDLKQKYHAKSIVIERVEKRLQIKKDKLDNVMNSQTRSDLIQAKSDEKKLTKQLEELKQEGEELYYDLTKKFSTVGHEQTTEENKLSSYKKRLYSEEYEVDKKRKELRVMRDQFLTKRNELLQLIDNKNHIEKVKQERDSWKDRLNIETESNSEEDGGNSPRAKLGRRNPYVKGSGRSSKRNNNNNSNSNAQQMGRAAQAMSRSPRNINRNLRNTMPNKAAGKKADLSKTCPAVKKKGNISTIFDDDGFVPHFDYDLYGTPQNRKRSTFRNLFDESFEPGGEKKAIVSAPTLKATNKTTNEGDSESQNTSSVCARSINQNIKVKEPPATINVASCRSPRQTITASQTKSSEQEQDEKLSETNDNNKGEEKEEEEKEEEKQQQSKPALDKRQMSQPLNSMMTSLCDTLTDKPYQNAPLYRTTGAPLKKPKQGHLSTLSHDDSAIPHLDYDLYGMPVKRKSSTYVNMFEDAFDPGGKLVIKSEKSTTQQNNSLEKSSNTTSKVDVNQLSIKDVTPMASTRSFTNVGQMDLIVNNNLSSLMDTVKSEKPHHTAPPIPKPTKPLKQGKLSTLSHDDNSVPHFDYDLYGTPTNKKKSTFRNMFNEAFDPNGNSEVKSTYANNKEKETKKRSLENNEDEENNNEEENEAEEKEKSTKETENDNNENEKEDEDEEEKNDDGDDDGGDDDGGDDDGDDDDGDDDDEETNETTNASQENNKEKKKTAAYKPDSYLAIDSLQTPKKKAKQGKLSTLAHDDDAVPHLDYDLYGTPTDQKKSSYRNMFDDSFNPK